MIKKKKGKGIKIHHNKKLFWIIILLIIVLIVLIYFIKQQESEKECIRDEECVAGSCCHPETCVAAEQAPECNGVMCSMVCSGPLDCGAGDCGCVKGKCEVISNE